ncbi:MAG: DSD1 family PLP-dependent enzyme [Pseudomonadales bacterium]|nr:DSD1 family PLP-dependent enzyme [Pseudomonadales bacterium]
MRRRALIAGGTGLVIGGAVWSLKPSARGNGGHNTYFTQLNGLMKKEGDGRPTMLIDLDALDHNIQVTLAELGSRSLRIVAKSLPSIPLLNYVSQASGSHRLMAFHEPFIGQMGAPETDVLLGKPMPVTAAAKYYARPQRHLFDASKQLQWLIDTPERLAQYAALAETNNLPLNLNIEIDVGLHRGGVSDPNVLRSMLATIQAHTNLRFTGLMGYDPHVAKMPDAFDGRADEFNNVQTIYADMLAVTKEIDHTGLTLNAAGSPTYQLWNEVNGLANELSVGSGLVKPLDFDIPTLANHKPALFIATPVLKTSPGVRIPGFDALGKIQGAWDPNRDRTFFVYGGYWKAAPVSPEGLVLNELFGRSTNQEMLNGSSDVVLGVDDYVFYRPTQSEFTMLQFGEILGVRGGRIESRWAPFSWA